MKWLKDRLVMWRWPLVLAALTFVALPMLMGAGPIAYCNPRGICSCFNSPEAAIGLVVLAVVALFVRG